MRKMKKVTFVCEACRKEPGMDYYSPCKLTNDYEEGVDIVSTPYFCPYNPNNITKWKRKE